MNYCLGCVSLLTINVIWIAETLKVFGGFTPVSKVPFDHERPPATIRATVKVVHDKNPKGYAKGVNKCHAME